MKHISTSDFRAFRHVLEPDDFALGPNEPDPPPSDLIPEGTWTSITSLPDDVSVRTSDRFGSVLEKFWEWWSAWNCLAGALQAKPTSPISHVACDAGDELQASIYNALVGFYRIGFSCLRNVLESMTIGLHLDLTDDNRRFKSWLDGDEEFGMGFAADKLMGARSVAELERKLKVGVGDDLFSPRTPASPGGLTRRLFRQLSKFTHGIPGFTDADLRNSNGPVFVAEAFATWRTTFLKTFAIAILDSKLARPTLNDLPWGCKCTAKDLYLDVVKQIPSTEDGASVLNAAFKHLW